MKKTFLQTLFVLYFLCFAFSEQAQTTVSNYKFNYTYDQSGNRVQRVMQVNQVAQKSDGVDSIPRNVVLVYPNPTFGLLNVTLTTFDNESYQLFDMMGKEIKRGSFTSAQTTIDISEEGSGQYLLRIFSKGKYQDYKIVKKS